MKATVLGAGGFVGRHLARHLEGRGFEVTRWVRGQSLPAELGVAFYAVGLTKDFGERPAATVEAHAGLLSRVLHRHGWDDFVYLSSTRLYDGSALGREDEAIPVRVARPRHLFDTSKLLGESCTLAAGGRVARLANVYSDQLDADAFIHHAVCAALKGTAEPICQHLDAARDYVHVEDVCRALLALVVGAAPSIVNLACGRNWSNAALFELLAHYTGHRLRAETARGAPPAPRVEIDRLEALGVVLRPLDTALPELLCGAGWGGVLPQQRKVA
ncbi:MAG: NAD-dependent epimerase/dehydratase family protein [Myxococcota bacterium]